MLTLKSRCIPAVGGGVITWEWRNPIEKALQLNPDSLTRLEPALELHSRAASSVGVTSPFQRSQHRKQFRRREEKNIYKLLFCFVFLCVWGWVGEKKICTTGFCWSKYLTFKGLSRDMRGHVLQEWGTSTCLLLYFLSILETEKKSFTLILDLHFFPSI